MLKDLDPNFLLLIIIIVAMLLIPSRRDDCIHEGIRAGRSAADIKEICE